MGPVVVEGRKFTASTLARITQWLSEHPGSSRRRLARQVCQWADWRASNGAMKEMSCRKALLRLHRAGHISLPPAREGPQRKAVTVTTQCEDPVARLVGDVRAIRRLELVPVRGRGRLAQRWKRLVGEYHYLGDRPLCGAQLRYLIRCEHGDLGALGFSAAALQLKDRDRWIGWTRAQRRVHREQVVCNSRFVLAGTVKVKNLASRVLAEALKRLAGDWFKQYGVRPVLVETFVDEERFNGACYKAANWIKVGKTCGRGRQDKNKQAGQSIKTIYVYPLARDCKKRLCRALAPSGEPAAADWAQEEFGRARLADKRLERRVCALARDFLHQPEANIPQACGSQAGSKAAYRLFANEQVKMEELLRSHREASVERIARERVGVVLAVQDSTTFNYSTHLEMEDLGLIGTTAKGPRGIWMHETMLYEPSGVPLGLLDVQLWSREAKSVGKRHSRKQRPIKEKESVKWLKSFRAAMELQRRVAGRSTVVSVGDREADVYELFALAHSDAAGPKVLVRAERKRRVSSDHATLWPHVEAQPIAAEYEVKVPRGLTRKRRQARMGVRFAQVNLRAPQGRSQLGAVKMWAVLAREIDPPAEVKPLEWMLLTTLEVSDAEQARRCVEYYRVRWSIEQYHRTLKSGCRIEDRRLESRHNWQNCLAIDLVVAWRIEHIKTLSRQHPDDLPERAFSGDEQLAVAAMFPKRAKNLTLATMTALVAQLGGFLGRKSDGPPGSGALWRGLQRIQDIATGIRLEQQRAGP